LIENKLEYQFNNAYQGAIHFKVDGKPLRRNCENCLVGLKDHLSGHNCKLGMSCDETKNFKPLTIQSGCASCKNFDSNFVITIAGSLYDIVHHYSMIYHGCNECFGALTKPKYPLNSIQEQPKDLKLKESRNKENEQREEFSRILKEKDSTIDFIMKELKIVQDQLHVEKSSNIDNIRRFHDMLDEPSELLTSWNGGSKADIIDERGIIEKSRTKTISVPNIHELDYELGILSGIFVYCIWLLCVGTFSNE
jgi:hypothetical protein